MKIKKKISGIVLSLVLASQVINPISKLTQTVKAESRNSMIENMMSKMDDLKEQRFKEVAEVINAAASKDPNTNITRRHYPIEKYEKVIKEVVSFGIGKIPVAGSVLGSVLNLVWPGYSQNYLWDKIRVEVRKMIDTSISENQYNNMLTTLNGLKAVSNRFLQAVDDYNKNKKIVSKERLQRLKSEIRSSFSSLNMVYLDQLEKFKEKDHKVLVLPMFVQAMNFYIISLRSVVLNGKEWGYDDITINTNKNNLSNQISKQVKYIDGVYKQGLQKRKDEALRDGTYKWNYVNKYNVFMQMYVLDFVAIWQHLDLKTYLPDTQFELSREIYSDIMGRVTSDGRNPLRNIGEIENKIINGYYKGELKKISVKSADRIDGISGTYERGYGKTEGFGISGPGGTLKTMNMFDFTGSNKVYNPIIGVGSDAQVVPFSLDFKFLNGQNSGKLGKPDPRTRYSQFAPKDSKLSTVSISGPTKIPGFESKTYIYKTEIYYNNWIEQLFGIKSYRKYKVLDKVGYPPEAVVFGFRPKNLFPINKLSSTESMVFSAQKYVDASGFTAQKEYLFGGNAMKSNGNKNSLKYKVEAPKDGIYKIRLKGSAKNKSLMNFYNNNNKVENFIYDPKNEGIQGNYGKYRVLNGPAVNLKKGENEIKIETTGNISLVDIEFVPQCIEPGIYLFENKGYQGKVEKLTSDRDTSKDITMKNPKSIKVVGGYLADLFEKDNFEGVNSQFTSDDGDFSNNEIGKEGISVSSIKIKSPEQIKKEKEELSKPGVYLFSAKNYRGKWMKLTEDINTSKDIIMKNPKSIKVVGGYVADLFEKDNFEGINSQFTLDDGDLSNNEIGKEGISVSSIKIKSPEQIEKEKEITISNPIMGDNIIDGSEKDKVIISGKAEPNSIVAVEIEDSKGNKVNNLTKRVKERPNYLGDTTDYTVNNRRVSSAVTFPYNYYSGNERDKIRRINLNQKYKKITGRLGLAYTGSENKNACMTISLDGKIMRREFISYNNGRCYESSFNLDVTNGKTLEFKVENCTKDSKPFIFDLYGYAFENIGDINADKNCNYKTNPMNLSELADGKLKITATSKDRKVTKEIVKISSK